MRLRRLLGDVMALRAKKAPDFDETANWLVLDEDGDLFAVMYYDAAHLGWHEDTGHNSKRYGDDWLGFNKKEALERLEARRIKNNPDGCIGT